MAEKGGVRRMNTRSSNEKQTNVAHESKWRKSQDHFECFTNLIGIELDGTVGNFRDTIKELEENLFYKKTLKKFRSGLTIGYFVKNG